MRRLGYVMSILVAAGLAAGPACAAGDAPAKVGQPAPAFQLSDQSGGTVKLADLAGRVVVLEWINPQCPFVQRHAKAGTMKSLAERYADRGVVWLGVNSTHFMDRGDDRAWHDAKSLPYPVLGDHDGAVGHLYGATTTPDMFVIDRSGILVYAGAIDDDPRGSKGKEATNYVAAALDEVLAGKPVAVPDTKPYGCSVKYGS